LKTLARLGARSDPAADDGAIYAPADDGAELRAAIAQLRPQGRIVIQELAGQAATADAMGCRYALVRQDGEWRIQPLAGD
jgi:ATP phosphoribosyltransferase regulatory subunit